MLLPSFNFEQTVSSQSAKQDKIEIKLEDGLLLANVDGVLGFLDVLGAPRANQRLDPDISPHGIYFARQQGNDDRLNNQLIRSVAFESGGRRFPAPLIAGHLEIFRVRGQSEAWHLNILASLNPTRFLRHQRIPVVLRPFSSESPPMLETNHFERSVGVSYDNEFSLCRTDLHKGDNWIPNSHSWQYYASKTSWPTYLKKCLTVWPQVLWTELNRAAEYSAASVPPAQITGQWKYNVRYVETYWEFTSLSPLGVVRSLEPMLKLFSNYLLEKTKYPCAITHEEIDNSWCLKLPTRIGETLKVYAKTNNRIRFEVVHDLLGGFRVPERRHTFRTTQAAYSFIEALAEIAAHRVNQALRHLRRTAYTPSRHYSALTLLTHVQNACTHSHLASDLLDMLINNQSIVVKKGNGITNLFSNALRQLERKRVLHKSNGRYSVTPPYRNALTQMRGGGIGFALAARQRVIRQ